MSHIPTNFVLSKKGNVVLPNLKPSDAIEWVQKIAKFTVKASLLEENSLANDEHFAVNMLFQEDLIGFDA